MSPRIATAATLEDLSRFEGKAELIGGRIIPLMATGWFPSRVAFRIARSLDDYATETGRGEAFTDNTGFAVEELSSGRQSFSPDAAYFLGPFPRDRMKFLPGAPLFAVEVRSDGDFGPAAEAEMAAKRADYFEAGTLAVWDVDPLARCVHLYSAEDPENPVTFTEGQVAHAEPALSGWQMPVDRIFE